MLKNVHLVGVTVLFSHTKPLVHLQVEVRAVVVLEGGPVEGEGVDSRAAAVAVVGVGALGVAGEAGAVSVEAGAGLEGSVAAGVGALVAVAGTDKRLTACSCSVLRPCAGVGQQSRYMAVYW